MENHADTMLWNGLRAARASVVLSALQAGANIGRSCSEDDASNGLEVGDTVLHAAFKPNMIHAGRKLDSVDVSEVVEVLLASGASSSATNIKGYTPLMLACSHEKLKVNAKTLGQLVQASKPVINHLGSGTSALHLAARKRNSAWVRKLLNAGADPGLLDAQGANALWPVLGNIDTEHLHANAKTQGYWKVVDSLVAGGADINQINHSGRSPVMAYQRIPVEQMVIRGANLALCVNEKSVLGEVLEALENRKRHPMYLVPTLERLAQTPGIDWSITAPSSGRGIRQVLMDMTAGEHYEEGQAVLSLIERYHLDVATLQPKGPPRGPRL